MVTVLSMILAVVAASSCVFALTGGERDITDDVSRLNGFDAKEGNATRKAFIRGELIL